MATHPVPPSSLAPADGYRLVRVRLEELLGGLTPAQADVAVACCPGWTVRDTLSHVVGACRDVLAGNTNTAGAPEWTAAHVEALRGRSVDQLLRDWADAAEQLIASPVAERALPQTTMDALSHEYDLRAALGAPAPEPDPVLPGTLDWLARRFGRYLDGRDVGTLRLICPDRERLLGGGDPTGTLRTSLRDAVRSLTGRRTLAQVRALDWDVDPGPWLRVLVWGPFAPPAQPVDGDWPEAGAA